MIHYMDGKEISYQTMRTLLGSIARDLGIEDNFSQVHPITLTKKIRTSIQELQSREAYYRAESD